MTADIPLYETNNPYVAWNPVTGTTQVVLIVKPHPRFGVDRGRGAETVLWHGKVDTKRGGFLGLRKHKVFRPISHRSITNK